MPCHFTVGLSWLLPEHICKRSMSVGCGYITQRYILENCSNSSVKQNFLTLPTLTAPLLFTQIASGFNGRNVAPPVKWAYKNLRVLGMSWRFRCIRVEALLISKSQTKFGRPPVTSLAYARVCSIAGGRERAYVSISTISFLGGIKQQTHESGCSADCWKGWPSCDVSLWCF